jgi:hypothetical protein
MLAYNATPSQQMFLCGWKKSLALAARAVKETADENLHCVTLAVFSAR